MQIQNTAVAIQHSGEQANTPSSAQFNQQLLAQILPELIRNPESLKSLMEIGEKYGGKK